MRQLILIYMYLYCIFVLVIFRWTSKILPQMKNSSEKNGQKEFPTPLAGIADQGISGIFFVFTSFKSYDFLKFVKKKVAIAIVDNKKFIRPHKQN